MAKKPIYRKIETYLRTEVLPNAEVGDELPTVNELTHQFDCRGVQTIRNAYAPLIAEGLVSVRDRPQRRWVLVKRPDDVPTAVIEWRAFQDELDSLETLAGELMQRISLIKNRYRSATFAEQQA